jgi:CRISPR/Cas system-associated exonuclease Cas4 (RecB family)
MVIRGDLNKMIDILCAKDRKKKKLDDCKRCATEWKCIYSPPLMKAIIDAIEDKRSVITATGIIGCLRRTMFKAKDNKPIDITKMYASVRGRLIHEALLSDRYTEPYYIKKQRFSISVGRYTLTGEPDLVDTKHNVLIDFKTVDFLPDKPYGKDVAQLNIYKVLCEHNGIDIKKMFLEYISMTDSIMFDIDIFPSKFEKVLTDRIIYLGECLTNNIYPSQEEGIECSLCEYAEECVTLTEGELIMHQI